MVSKNIISIHALREEGDAETMRWLKGEAQFLSTPSVRRATPRAFVMPPAMPISIHALREEGDGIRTAWAVSGGKISIHALREEGDPKSAHCDLSLADFYPRPPRGGRQRNYPQLPPNHCISIHALREEGDRSALYSRPLASKFLSTPSARRATAPRTPAARFYEISIHALREEGDTGPCPRPPAL